MRPRLKLLCRLPIFFGVFNFLLFIRIIFQIILIRIFVLLIWLIWRIFLWNSPMTKIFIIHFLTWWIIGIVIIWFRRRFFRSTIFTPVFFYISKIMVFVFVGTVVAPLVWSKIIFLFILRWTLLIITIIWIHILFVYCTSIIIGILLKFERILIVFGLVFSQKLPSLHLCVR